MLEIILTIVFIGLLVFLLVKGYNPSMSMLVLALLALGIQTLISGQSIMGEATSGNNFFDLFEFIFQTASNAFKKNILIIMAIFGYVAFMDHMKASKMFAAICSKPLKKLNKPYLLCLMAIVFAAVVKLVIPSAVGNMALLLATVYPILLACGVTVPTAAATLWIGTMMLWGPADIGTLQAYSYAGLELNSAHVFVSYHVPMFLMAFVAYCIVHIPMQKYFDKKDAQKGISYGAKETEELDASSVGVPKLFAILPLLPLILAIIFSSLVVKVIEISLVGAVFISFLISFVIYLLYKKNVKESFNDSQHFFAGTGSYVGRSAWMIVTGTIYGTALVNIGGVEKIVEFVSGAGGGSLIFFAVFVCVMGGIITALAMITPSLAAICPMVATYCTVNGIAAVEPLVMMVNTCSGLGGAFYPAGSGILLLSGTTDVPIFTIMKRVAADVALAAVFVIVGSLLIYF